MRSIREELVDNTEAQIAAKKAKAAKGARNIEFETREPHHTEAQIAAKKAKAAKGAHDVEELEARRIYITFQDSKYTNITINHTGVQIAAKKAKAAGN